MNRGKELAKKLNNRASQPACNQLQAAQSTSAYRFMCLARIASIPPIVHVTKHPQHRWLLHLHHSLQQRPVTDFPAGAGLIQVSCSAAGESAQLHEIQDKVAICDCCSNAHWLWLKGPATVWERRWSQMSSSLGDVWRAQTNSRSIAYASAVHSGMLVLKCTIPYRLENTVLVGVHLESLREGGRQP